MNKILGFAAGGAAIVVAVVLGARLLGPPASSGPGGAPISSPVPSASAEPTADASVAQPSSPADGSLPEGAHVLSHPDGIGPAVTLTIPGPGWTGDAAYGVIVRNNDGDPPDGAAIIGPFFGDFHVYGDPCRWSTTMPDSPATTVDAFVAAMTSQASRNASAPVDITVDGYTGKSITVHVPDDSDDTACDQGKFASWAGGGDSLDSGPSRYHQGPGQIDELWILDVDGELVVVDAMYGAETPAEYVDEIHALLESMTFGQ